MVKTIYTKTHKSLVKKLVNARRKAGLTQKDVAKKLKKTQSYVSKMEGGQCRIDIVQLRELSEIYKKSPDYFIK